MKIFLLTIFLLSASTLGIAQSVKFELTHPATDSFYYIFNDAVQVVINDKETQDTSIERQTVTYRYHILSDDKGKLDCSVKVHTLFVESASPTDTLFYHHDSRQAIDTDTFKNRIKLIQDLINTPFEFSLDGAGRSQFFEHTLKQFDFNQDTIRQSLAEQVRFNEESIRKNLAEITGFYPNKTIKTGQRWEIIDSTYTGFQLVKVTSYMLKEIGDKYALINFQSYFDPNFKAQKSPNTPIDIRFNLTGLEEGYIIVELKTGWPIKMEMTQQITGTASIFFESPIGLSLGVELLGKRSFTRKDIK